MPGPPPLTGMLGFVNARPEAPPEKIQGGIADPRHDIPGERSHPYSWESQLTMHTGPHGPYGAENALLDRQPEDVTFPAGQLKDDPDSDLTPYRGHAAPWPKGIESSTDPDAVSRQLEQSASIHASDLHASRNFQHFQAGLAIQDDWVGFFNPVPGNDNVPPTPGQVAVNANGFGVNDHRSNPYAKVNEFDLATSHRHRRYAAGAIPGNNMWMQPGGRPLVRSLPSIARPATGIDSPFAGQDTTQSFNYDGAILQDGGTEYVPPPTPYVQPQTVGVTESPTIALW